MLNCTLNLGPLLTLAAGQGGEEEPGGDEGVPGAKKGEEEGEEGGGGGGVQDQPPPASPAATGATSGTAPRVVRGIYRLAPQPKQQQPKQQQQQQQQQQGTLQAPAQPGSPWVEAKLRCKRSKSPDGLSARSFPTARADAGPRARQSDQQRLVFVRQ